MNDTDYVLGHAEAELRRLSTQARLIDPITRRFLEAAGIAKGMRILDKAAGPAMSRFSAANSLDRLARLWELTLPLQLSNGRNCAPRMPSQAESPSDTAIRLN
ncbi:hypothetical protein [Mesorhizobium kowhaii]|uniref:hypothetical protein n=1 Tax=Mesorhizobium kowhaii TaxID=1300272 RepID=UPI001FDF260A|nr:hypothetical protein [Mesorhizobium kowhaii]